MLSGAYCVDRVHNMLLEGAYCVGSILWLFRATKVMASVHKNRPA